MSKPQRLALAAFLNRLCKRSLLNEEEQAAILSLPATSRQVHANRDVVRLGEQLDHSCLIADGYVARFDQNAQGDRQITALHIPGDMADLHSVVQPEATSALQAITTATVLRVPHRAIRAVAASYPAVAEALWRDCMVDASILAQWIVNVGRRDAKARLAHLLCEVVTRLGLASSGNTITFPFRVTQNQLADMASITAVHANRTIQALRRDGLADIRPITRILDWEALERVADFDAGYLQLENRPCRRLQHVGA